MTDKIFILGLDGVDPSLIERYAGEGKIPNLKRFMDGGVYARLKSVLPTITTVTWTSFLTGKNPGKHGIYGFVNFKNNSHELKILNSFDRKCDAVWSFLNYYGKTVGIFNMPSLYPPEKINGFMVCGMLTPNKKCNFMYPAELQAELFKEIKDYEIDLGVLKVAEDNKKGLLNSIYFLTDKRFETARYLYKKYPCDVFISIVTETDRIQHHFINDEKALSDYFGYLDKRIGEFVNSVGKGATIFVLSDHGIGPIKKFISVNKWLYDEGLLKFKSYSVDNMKRFFSRKFIQWVVTLLSRFKFNVEMIKLVIPARLLGRIVTLYCYPQGMDWQNTKAYFCLGGGESIFINSKRRFADGIVSDEEYEKLRDGIIAGISGIKDPATGKPVVEKAHKREELFTGSALHDAPDIVLHLGDGYANNDSADSANILTDVKKDEMFVGEHRLKGIFIAYGDSIKPNRAPQSFSILDIAPTLLYRLGAPVPPDFDGRILRELFKKEIERPTGDCPPSESDRLRKKIKSLKLSGRIKQRRSCGK